MIKKYFIIIISLLFILICKKSNGQNNIKSEINVDTKTTLIDNDVLLVQLINKDKIDCKKNLISLKIKKEKFRNCAISVDGYLNRIEEQKGFYSIVPYCDRKDSLSLSIYFLKEDGSKPILGETKLKIYKTP
jgi:hypothetical protein